MKSKSSNFFKVITQSQTYLNLSYLLLSFPLGIFYFVFIITGLSLGLGLIITWFGIPILFGTLLLWNIFASFERQQARTILGISIPFVPIKQPKGILKKMQSYLKDSSTWKNLAYLFIKFPLGIISFVVLVTLLSISLSLIAAPLLYYLSQTGMFQVNACISQTNICFMDNYFTIIIVAIIGIFLLFTSLHILNGLAYISGLLAKSMLEKKK